MVKIIQNSTEILNNMEYFILWYLYRKWYFYCFCLTLTQTVHLDFQDSINDFVIGNIAVFNISLVSVFMTFYQTDHHLLQNNFHQIYY